ncbi:hypothetical protein BKH31_02395, partial [Actinomyces oris]
MDPVQLMMAAHQADAAVAAQTPDQALQAAIAQSRPDLWGPLSTNPATYPDLLGWLASTGNVEVLANLRARGYLTDDAAADAADAVCTAGAAGGEPTVVPALAQESPEPAEPAEDGGTLAEEDEAADESEPAEESGSEPSDAAGEGSAESADAAEGAADEAVDADDSGEADG